MKKRLSFLGSLIAAIALTWLIREPSFNESQVYVLFLLVFSIGLWLTEAVPPFAVGLLIIAYLVFTMGYEKFTTSPQDIHIYTNTFSSSVIWLMMGGFFLASAMTRTRLDADLIRLTLKMCGAKPSRILFGMMMVTMVASMLISNTATTSMVIAAVMPLIASLGSQSKVAKGLVLGVPVAATTGGMGTLIGSPPNAVAAGALAAVNEPVDFVTWIFFGLPVTIVLTIVAWWVLVRIFMKSAKDFEASPEDGTGIAVDGRQRIVVLSILIVTLVMWLTSPLHHISAAAVSAIPLVFLPLTGILKGEDIRAMGWDTLILVAGGLSLGTALQHTGLLDLYAQRIASLPLPPISFYFILAYATMIFSNIMSNTATSTVLIPLGMAILPEHRTEIAMIIGLSASTALFLPVSTPPNAIAYSTGVIGQNDFRVGGVLIGLLGPFLIVAWVLILSGLIH